jgi:hypothetical protein
MNRPMSRRWGILLAAALALAFLPVLLAAPAQAATLKDA